MSTNPTTRNEAIEAIATGAWFSVYETVAQDRPGFTPDGIGDGSRGFAVAVGPVREVRLDRFWIYSTGPEVSPATSAAACMDAVRSELEDLDDDTLMRVARNMATGATGWGTWTDHADLVLDIVTVTASEEVARAIGVGRLEQAIWSEATGEIEL